MILLKTLLLSSLLFIAYEDFRYRALSLYAIISFFLVAVIYAFYLQSFKTAFFSMLINLVTLTLQLAATWLYFRIFRKNGSGFINTKLGMGDLLFYVPVLFLFSPLNFVFIHIGSLLMVLIGFAIYGTFVKQVKTIPLAGGLSVVFSAAFILSWILPGINFYDDMFIADILFMLQR